MRGGGISVPRRSSTKRATCGCSARGMKSHGVTAHSGGTLEPPARPWRSATQSLLHTRSRRESESAAEAWITSHR